MPVATFGHRLELNTSYLGVKDKGHGLVCVVLANPTTLWEQLRAPIAVILEIFRWPPSKQSAITLMASKLEAIWGEFAQAFKKSL